MFLDRSGLYALHIDDVTQLRPIDLLGDLGETLLGLPLLLIVTVEQVLHVPQLLMHRWSVLFRIAAISHLLHIALLSRLWSGIIRLASSGSRWPLPRDRDLCTLTLG